MSLPNIELQQALQHHQNKNFSQAEEAYRTIISRNELDPSVYPNLVDVYNQQGKFEQSVQLLLDGIEKMPGNPQLPIMLAQTYAHIGTFGEAKRIMLELVERFPNMGETHYILGTICMQQQNLDEAYSCFEKSISFLPQLAEAYYNLGVIHYQKKEWGEAKEKWLKSTELSPALLQAWLNLANLSIDQTYYDKAIEYLGHVLKHDPEHFSAIKMMGMAFHASNKPDEALEMFLKIDSEEKPSEEVLVLIANVYRDLERMEEADNYYRKVLDINPDNEIAKSNVEKILGSKISGWHFNMLGDLSRNQGYNEAIDRVIKNNDIVLDIGTGSGLLSLMCARAGAKHIYTCETIEPLAAAAIDVIKDNGYSDKITLYHAKSSKLQVGRELPEKADVLVSEILDAGLLGEGVLPSVRHAQANLLKENARIIPAAATVKGVLIESEHLRVVSPMKNISGFDLSSFGRFQVTNSYRQAILKSIPHGRLSSETTLLSIDFYNLPDSVGNEVPNKKDVEFEVTKDGVIDSIAFWFDLHIDEKLTLSSGPEGEMIHWGQAIYNFPESKRVKKGEQIGITVLQSETNILFSFS